jgi:deazaflavin-dependent oxidoreductase (nitroreductase family)
MRLQQSLADIGLKAMSRAHRAIHRWSGGRLLATPLGMPAVELHTIGRTSRLPRSTMLSAPVADAGRVVLVASKGGDDRHPDWYQNLIAHPEIELTMTGQRKPMLARRASPAEKAVLWPRVVAAYYGYAADQRRTKRDIPLVICEPR